MASIGGNLMQRPRCLYFRDVTAACNRRTPGAGCAAIGGRNRTHAILGTSDACVATHPSDLAVALVALDATVITRDGNGERPIPIADFFRQPGDTPDGSTICAPAQLITAIEVPVRPEARRSGYLKVRDRESYEFALASAAVALDIDGGRGPRGAGGRRWCRHGAMAAARGGRGAHRAPAQPSTVALRRGASQPTARNRCRRTGSKWSW